MEPDLTDDDMAGLSDTERAALGNTSEDEDTLRAIAGKEAPAGGDDTLTGAAGNDTLAGDDDGDDDEPTAAEAKAAKDAADAKAAAEAAKAKPGDAAVADAAAAAAAPAAPAPASATEQPIVAFTATAPEDAVDQIKALRGEKAVAFKQLMDGELTPEQYSAKEDEILGKITEIDRSLTTASVAAEFTVQQAQRSYHGKVNALLDAAAKEGIDYRAPANKALHAELDRAVKFLASDPTNADKTEQWFLDEGHAMVKARHGLGKPAAAPASAPAAAAGRVGKAPDVSGLPPSVRSAPPAADSDDGGEFAHLTTLNGMALERAIAKMTPEQQQRWAEAD